jgi:F-type H+-transporting ATPase subunit gamma
MAENLIDLRRRITSVKNTQKITRAMKTVSAVKLRKSLAELKKSGPMMDKIEYLLGKVGVIDGKVLSPFLENREEGKTIVVSLSADKGLCGAFNSNVISKAEKYIKKLEEDGEQVSLITAGKKSFKYYNKKNREIMKDYSDFMSDITYKSSLDFSKFLQDVFLKDKIKKIDIVYYDFISTSRQEVIIKQLFPIKTNWDNEEDDVEVEYIFEPAPEEIFAALLPKYINSVIYRILMGNIASEHSSRMIAMDLATRNASDMIKSLTLTMNKIRQAAITKELLEIITATEALSK